MAVGAHADNIEFNAGGMICQYPGLFHGSQQHDGKMTLARPPAGEICYGKREIDLIRPEYGQVEEMKV